MSDPKHTLKIWDCKIGEVDPSLLPRGSDAPMRSAVERAYFEITGQQPAFIFSGWGAELTEAERAAHENRLPSEAHERRWHVEKAAPELLEALKRAERMLVEQEDSLRSFGASEPDAEPAILFARETIARAEGGA